jgi:hypothetical protein
MKILKGSFEYKKRVVSLRYVLSQVPDSLGDGSAGGAFGQNTLSLLGISASVVHI